MVGLAFSGGGTRAAAFGYGVLRGFDEVVVDRHPKRRTAVDDIRMISGTSGGSVPAAYFGYKGRAMSTCANVSCSRTLKRSCTRNCRR